MYEVTVKKSFSTAHTLKGIGGRCEELHGHNFVVEVSVTTPDLNREGLAIDFRVLKGWTEEVLETLDHKYLNDVPYFNALNPSAENIARFVYERIAQKAHLQKIRVSQVIVWESEDARVSYNGGFDNGRISVEIELENYLDKGMALKGYIKESEIRRAKVKALVDTGAVLLMLPQDLVEELGLEYLRRAIVRYADERLEERDVAGVVIIKIGKRIMSTDCIVGPPRSEPLIGQIVLEGMDLIIDPVEQKLTPRPESPYLPELKLK